jgi:magnesium chelatase family protein
LNSGLPWPGHGVAVNLQPLGLPKHGTGLDLAIAVAVLTAAGTVAATPDRCLFYGELGLDGSLRPARGALPAVLAAARAGCIMAVLPEQNAAEAAAVPGATVIPCRSLRAVVSWLRGDPGSARPDAGPVPVLRLSDVCPQINLDQVAVPPLLRLAVENSAAGGHHLCLTGPGAPITALAAAVPALMPPPQHDETLDVAAAHSAAGLLGPGHAVITRPPFRAPHHTITPAGMAGGGSGLVRPGEAALAHRACCSSLTPPSSPAAS